MVDKRAARRRRASAVALSKGSRLGVSVAVGLKWASSSSSRRQPGRTVRKLSLATTISGRNTCRTPIALRLLDHFAIFRIRAPQSFRCCLKCVHNKPPASTRTASRNVRHASKAGMVSKRQPLQVRPVRGVAEGQEPGLVRQMSQRSFGSAAFLVHRQPVGTGSVVRDAWHGAGAAVARDTALELLRTERQARGCNGLLALRWRGAPDFCSCFDGREHDSRAVSRTLLLSNDAGIRVGVARVLLDQAAATEGNQGRRQGFAHDAAGVGRLSCSILPRSSPMCSASGSLKSTRAPSAAVSRATPRSSGEHSAWIANFYRRSPPKMAGVGKQKIQTKRGLVMSASLKSLQGVGADVDFSKKLPLDGFTRAFSLNERLQAGRAIRDSTP